MYRKDQPRRKVDVVKIFAIASAALLLGSNIYLFDKCDSLEKENQELMSANNELKDHVAKSDKLQTTLSNDKVELEQENEKLTKINNKLSSELDACLKQLAETTAELYMAQHPIIPEDGEVQDVDYDPENITCVSGLSGDQFNDLIDIILVNKGLSKNNPLYGTGDAFEYIEDEYDINGVYVLAIFSLESAFATKCCNSNNFGGIRGGHGWKYFNTPEDCIYYEGNLLKTKYVDYGLKTLSDIGDKYCEGGGWDDSVQSFVDIYCDYMTQVVEQV